MGSGLPSTELVAVDQFGATVGQSIGSHLVVASTIKLVHALSDTHPDLDLGAMAAVGVLRLGVTVRDVRQPSFGAGTDVFELPRRARAGAALIAPPLGRIDRLTLSFDADLTTATVNGQDERTIAGGVEAWILGRRVAVRGGLGANTVGDNASFGAFGLSVAASPSVFVDGAATRGSNDSWNRWGIDLRLTF